MGFFDTITNTFTEVDKKLGGVLPGGVPFNRGSTVTTQPNATTTSVTPINRSVSVGVPRDISPAGQSKEAVRNANRSQQTDTSFLQQNKEVFRQPTPQRDFKETAFDVLKLGIGAFPGIGGISFLADQFKGQPLSLQAQLSNAEIQGRINAQNFSNAQQEQINDLLTTDFVGRLDPRRILGGVEFDTTRQQAQETILTSFLPKPNPLNVETPFAQGGVLQLGDGTREPGIFEQIGSAGKDLTIPIVALGGLFLVSKFIGNK
jgi:hypothetical protein